MNDKTEIPVISNPAFFKLLISKRILFEKDFGNLVAKYKGNSLQFCSSL